jgi:putative ABC transport system permease protein
MNAEYILWAVREARSRPWLSLIVTIVIAVGVAIPSVLVPCWALLASDPAPGRSSRLFHIQLDPLGDRRNISRTGIVDASNGLPEQLTFMDARRLLAASIVVPRSAFYEFMATAGNPRLNTSHAITVAAAHADFFRMMGAPIASGRAWGPDEERDRARVVVLSEALNDRLYAGHGGVGSQVWLSGAPYTVVGVLGPWRPPTKFFSAAIYSQMDDAYVPFDSAIDQRLAPTSPVRCESSVATALPELENSECQWVNYWVELSGPDIRAAYEAFLQGYVADQKMLGRFPRSPSVRILDVNEWLAYLRRGTGVASTFIPATAIGFAMMFTTISNAIALLLAKFVRNQRATALRRALGATRRDIVEQHLTECVLVGLIAGFVGMCLAFGILSWARHTLELRLQPYGFSLEATSRLDWQVAAAAIAFGVTGAVAAGLFPAWRLSRVSVASSLMDLR